MDVLVVLVGMFIVVWLVRVWILTGEDPQDKDSQDS